MKRISSSGSAMIKTKGPSVRPLGSSRSTKPPKLKDTRDYSRAALNDLAKGERTINNYAKATPIGAGSLGPGTFLNAGKIDLE